MNVPAQTQAPQLPAHLQGFASKSLSKQVATNIGSAAPPYISIEGNKYTLIDAAGNAQPAGQYDQQLGVYLDCVIWDVADHISKVYYEKAYDPSSQTFAPPDCWSDNGVGPSRQASKPQSPLCATCPKNEWGSAVSKVSGKGVKACNDQQKVAVFVPGYQPIFLLRIPPNSLKNFRAYAERFNGQGFDMDVMVTRLSFEPQGVGTLLFQAVNWIDQPMMALIADARGRNAADSLLGRNDTVREAAPAALPGPAAAPMAATAVPPGMPGGGPAAGFVPSPLPAGTAAVPAATPAQAPPAQPSGFPTQQATPSASAPATAPTASPSEQAPRQRRRRSTAAEAPPAQPQGAPFPHPGAAAAPAAPPPAAPQSNFGIVPGAAADPALSAALNTVFGQNR